MLHAQTVPVFLQQTRALIGQLNKASSWCADNGVAEADLLDTRLAPDMFPLSQQLHFVAAQMLRPMRSLTGLELPDPAEAGPTLDAHRVRLNAAISLLEPLSVHDVDSDPHRMIALEVPNGMVFDLTAADFVRDWALPQYWFHMMTAYALMRLRGIPLGKADFVPYMIKHRRKA